MGIPGLTTFIENWFDGKWLKCEPKGHLVIDGYSLCYTLHVKIDWIHGGQYSLFRQHLLRFFKSLKSSGISPIAVFDGIDYKQEKQAVIFKRRVDNVRVVKKQLTAGDHSRDGSTVLPILAIEVFREVLEELHVPLYFADGEADPDTVAMAAYYKCPVVANDSDYYMFKGSHGYIPLSRLHWESRPVTADMYTMKQFERGFNIRDSHLTHMIPAMLGNDFVNGVFDSHLKEYIVFSVKNAVDSSRKSSHIRSLVQYIAKFENVSELLADVSGNVDNGRYLAKKLSGNLEKVESFYNISRVLHEENLMNETALITSNGSKVPEWVLRQYRHGYFVSSLMETLVIGQAFLRVVTDDPQKPSAQLASRCIRQSIYGMLLPLMKEETVSEVVRFEANLRHEQIHCSPSGALPAFSAVQDMSGEQKVVALCSVIGIDPLLLESFDRKWKLVVGAGCYWVKECRPNKHLIKSLVLCLMFCSQARDPISLLPRFVREDRNGKWMDALHKFSSFQCIYLDLSKLNNMLLNPLLFVSPAFLFDGKLAQFYACKKDLDKIVEREFKGSLLYFNLFETLTSCIVQKSKGEYHGTTTAMSQQDEVKSKPKKVSSAISSNPFAMLADDSDEELDDSD